MIVKYVIKLLRMIVLTAIASELLSQQWLQIEQRLMVIDLIISENFYSI